MTNPQLADVDRFRVPPDATVNLANWPTVIDPLYASKRDYKDQLKQRVAELRESQNLLYAHDRYALLLVFQAMDAAGKDGAIKHVMSGVNPQGCQVYSFKHPSAEDLDHDFLWRCHKRVPERGRIGIFNRSYYEEVLIVRVVPEIFAGQRLPADNTNHGSVWDHRFQSINELELHLHRNGTRIVKFFLHLSKDEQKRRFLERIDDPRKNWKIRPADLEQRVHWEDYMTAYGECLGATSTDHAPWYCVPADDKKTARLIVSRVIVNTLDALAMSYPAPSMSPTELAAIRSELDR